MAKYVVVVVAVAVIFTCQAFPAMENDIASAAANGQWDIVQKILEDSYRSKYSLTPLSQIDLRSYRVNDGEKFYGESDSQFHYSSNVNGKINQRSGGHRIINDNGQVSEYDYKPSSPSYQNIQQF
ncbi:uncharacterized protein LOC113230436 [Hyposmocoma kahamanoa]|uniref:uncharacterized protein LOC113230436 n=1 Tax=Hyposmocoma kahamanoa TaxID=1477025 RepID=UPI000E6D91D8|nr:uncharacterized protein LOC113230436 [Hyposmocoma kahamanoa]